MRENGTMKLVVSSDQLGPLVQFAVFFGDEILPSYMGVSKNSGGPPKWMVKIMENPIKMDDLGVPLFLETPI